MSEPRMVDPHDVLMTGENSFIRLSNDGGKTIADRVSHWRVLWSPAGQGHALFGGQLDHRLRPQAAVEMDVQLGLGQTRQSLARDGRHQRAPRAAAADTAPRMRGSSGTGTGCGSCSR